MRPWKLKALMSRQTLRNARSAGVTLLELLTVIVVIAILVTMLVPVLSNMIARMERSRCTANLRTLFVATELYVQDHRQWPQISTQSLGTTGSDQYARDWIAVLTPYKVSEESWHCPTVQKAMTQAAQPKQPSLKRIDYYPTPFDDKEITPHRWSTQPWFIERGAVHGRGNLIIFTDGSIKSLDDMLTQIKKK